MRPSIKEPSLFLKTLKHNNDPLGDIYSVLMNIKNNDYKDVADCILSFLSYTESTLNHIGDKTKESYGCSSNPKNNRNGEQPYGTEMVILISPPKQTKLPSKQCQKSSMEYLL